MILLLSPLPISRDGGPGFAPAQAVTRQCDSYERKQFCNWVTSQPWYRAHGSPLRSPSPTLTYAQDTRADGSVVRDHAPPDFSLPPTRRAVLARFPAREGHEGG